MKLLGCPYQPLGSYLKALAVLRLITQRDKSARGFWGYECFVLQSNFDEEALVKFFLEEYRPTPVLAPWNGGSGFYPKDRKVGLDAIRGTTSERFAVYRTDLHRAESIVAEVGAMDDEGERRTEILRRCRNELSDACVDWLDAAIAISAEESRAFAPVLGTGGNEGRLDYTNNFMENLSRLVIAPDKKMPVRSLLEHALFGRFTGGMQSIPVGQYDPGRAGGFNQGEGIDDGSIANPWNAVLTLEGAVAWAGGIYRKQGIAYRSFLCSPFTVRPSAVGYGSATGKDEESARAELWTPLWNKPTRFGEISALLREGRAAVDGKPAQTGLDFAKAAASLGVDRGITAFVRYNLLKRRGDSYIALPTGRFPVTYQSAADLVREMDPFVRQADTAAKSSGGEVPNSWPPLMRALEEATFQALLHGKENLLVEVAASFGAMHRWLLQRKREVKWPGRLSWKWVEKCGQSKPEVTIAASLAGLWSQDAGGILENLSADNNRFSWIGRSLTERMLRTVRRRTLDGAQGEGSPFWSRSVTSPQHVVQFLERGLDEGLLENLLFAFALVEQKDERTLLSRDQPEGLRRTPVYCLLKQFFAASAHPGANADGDDPRFRPDLGIATLLAANRVKEATETAMRRLRNAGLNPRLRNGFDSDDGIRIGAALLIPVWGVNGVVRESFVDAVEEEEVGIGEEANG